MSEQSIDLVRRIYEAWSRNEFPGPAELLDPDVEYVNPPDAVEPGTRRGLAEFARAVETIFESWSEWRAKPERFEAAGDRVAVLVRSQARGKTSDVAIQGSYSALFTVRDGRLVRFEWFRGPDDAFEALV